jgi:hypothetical protein
LLLVVGVLVGKILAAAVQVVTAVRFLVNRQVAELRLNPL